MNYVVKMCICMLNMLLGAIPEVDALLCSTHCFWGSGNFNESSLSKVNIAGDQVLRSLLGSLVVVWPAVDGDEGGGGGDDNDDIDGGAGCGWRRRWWRRVVASGVVDRVDREKGSVFEMVPYGGFACPCGAEDVVLRESYKPKTRGKLYYACPRSKKEERVHLLIGSPGASTTLIYSSGSSSTLIYSPGSSTPPHYSPRASTPQSYSLGTSRNAECSNCKHLLDKITHPIVAIPLQSQILEVLQSDDEFDEDSNDGGHEEKISVNNSSESAHMENVGENKEPVMVSDTCFKVRLTSDAEHAVNDKNHTQSHHYLQEKMSDQESDTHVKSTFPSPVKIYLYTKTHHG
nr:hypothetical protein [Tanacetum cinerariifolium]